MQLPAWDVLSSDHFWGHRVLIRDRTRYFQQEVLVRSVTGDIEQQLHF